MRRLVLAACLFLVATSAFSQSSPVPPAPAPAAAPAPTPSPPVYNVPLTDQMIDMIIVMGSVCLQAKGYECGAAVEMRTFLNEARKPKPKAP